MWDGTRGQSNHEFRKEGNKTTGKQFEEIKIKVEFADEMIISSDNFNDKLLDCV